MRVVNIFFPLVLVLALGGNLQPDFNDNIVIKDQKVHDKMFTVNHKLKNKDLYIECIIPNFNFTQNEQARNTGDGYLVLYMNGTKVDEIHRAAFIMKDLPAGKHSIKVQVVHNDNTPYKGMSKEIEVTVQ